MKIVDHCLILDDDSLCKFVESPNVGGVLSPKYLVMHYTAGQTTSSAVNWFKNPAAKASAHLLIGRDGEVIQMVPFNRVAWHAGRSQWKGVVGLNQYSVGIELVNAGRLSQRGDQWTDWTGKIVPPDEVVVATHANENAVARWQAYTTVQIETALEAALALYREYGLTECVGHEDVAPYRKSDPGPAFPMGSFRARLVGRKDDDSPEVEDCYITTANLNIRIGPGTEFEKLQGSPLPASTKVQVLERHGKWWLVEVLGEVPELFDPSGWVHSGYLQAV